jgi:chemotaxis protein methyltransferase CheR
MADFEYLQSLLRQRAALVLESGKAYLAEARLLPVARRAGCTSVGELLGRLRAVPVNGLHEQVVEAMTINETSFFRDVLPFEALRQEVLPGLIERRQGERRLHLWSAGCSSGQEPYSLALLLNEHFPNLDSWDVTITATDLSTAMLERAQRGRYSQMEINRGLSAQLLVKYFRRQGLDWEIDEAIRGRVEFRPLNLAESFPPLPLVDVVLLRNVLIYFDVATRKEVLGRVVRVLRPDGALFLGGAETTLGIDDTFERVACGKSSYHRLRRGGR